VESSRARTDLHATHEGRPEAAEDAQTRHRHRLAEWVRDEIDVMAERGEGADAMELAERVPRGSKNGSGAIIKMRTVRVIFSRIRAES